MKRILLVSSMFLLNYISVAQTVAPQEHISGSSLPYQSPDIVLIIMSLITLGTGLVFTVHLFKKKAYEDLY